MSTLALGRVVVALPVLLTVGLIALPRSAGAAGTEDKPALPPLVRSAGSGPWSVPATWEGRAVPAAGARVQVRPGHTVVYDVAAGPALRSVHVAGTLSFAADRDTRLDVGLLKIQPGEDASENGFDCDAHMLAAKPGGAKPALEVGTPDRPIAAGHTAVIRLVLCDGLDRESCPAIVCCGGRMDFHGAPLSRTWVKLGATAAAGSDRVTLSEPVTGWRVGDRVIVTATTRQMKLKKTFTPSVRDHPNTEERTVTAVDGPTLTLDQPLTYEHLGTGAYRGEVADLSRNVVVESADPAAARGHTMYHHGSAGSIGYAEFRHLGKEGVLGRYSLHFHLVGDSMRGSSVIGASIWDSGNRWLTIHGTDYLVVSDCVGYQSVGHGFFLEDGTEAFNVLDRNLAVQAFGGKPLPKQVLPFDHNDGAGFWWANSLNTFTRNVACECDEYGYRFDASPTDGFDLALPVRQPDGSRRKVDVRTLPFVRFEDNESHCQRRHAFNLGGIGGDLKGGVGGVGPDARHPFVVRNMKVWNAHWAFHPLTPSLLVDGLEVYNAEYGLWRPAYERHAYRRVRLEQITVREEFTPKGVRPKEEDFPAPLDPVDDLPPATVITGVTRSAGRLLVRGTTSDNGTVTRVVLNGREARPLSANFAEWEAALDDPPPGGLTLTAHAEDAAGNVEKTPHVLVVNPSR
jgi:hypothetical protein